MLGTFLLGCLPDPKIQVPDFASACDPPLSQCPGADMIAGVDMAADMTVDGKDLGMPQDLAVTPDLAVVTDLATLDGPPPATMLSLIAGGLGGAGSVDGTGPAARFSGPAGVAADGAGNFYVADFNNQTIRKVVGATGAVSILAGATGQSGSTDGVGAAARFFQPSGVATDGAGNLYVAEEGNQTIRKVVLATGATSTLVGTAGMAGNTDGTGPAARFRGPTSVAVDAAGNLFVADYGNFTIRRVVVATGAVTTLAGTAGVMGSADGTGAAARFSGPSGVVADGVGNLYVVDLGNHTIRKVAVATGVVSTLVGTAGASGSTDGTGAAARFKSPYGAVLDGAGNLYVSDSANQTLRKVVLATSAVTTLAGTAGAAGSADGTGPAARFANPEGMAADGAGSLYVAEFSNNTIRQVTIAAGAVTTLAGAATLTSSADGTGSAARFNRPQGVAADSAGNLFIADMYNHTIRKVVAATGVVTTLAGLAKVYGSTDGSGPAARFYSPEGVVLDGAGNLLVTDSGNSTIRKVAIATGAVTTLAGTATMDGSSDGTGPAARFRSPAGLAVDGAGNLNGDYEAAYTRWLTTTCKRWNPEHAIYSAKRHARSVRSVA